MTTSALFASDVSRAAIEQAYERLRADTPQAQPQRVSTRFGETHMLVGGPVHAPPLVVLHGKMANSAMAMRDGHALMEKFRVYALDVIGQSVKSADVRLGWDGAAYSNWLVDVLDGLGLAKAHVYGVSGGGFIACALAARLSERIDRLVMLAPAGIINAPALRVMAKMAAPMLLYRAMGSRGALARFVDSMLTVPDPLLTDYFGVALKHYKLDMAIPSLATPEMLAGFRRPTLVIGASDDITAPGPALLARARVLFPHAVCELLENCKHVPPTDDASRAQLCARVARFLLGEATVA